MSISADFWLSSGHHLLDHDGDGRLVLTDEFLKAYLARPELTPPTDACIAERTMHEALLADPRRAVAPTEVAAIADADARENWELLLSWRDHVTGYSTLEAAYLAIVRGRQAFPPLFINQLVQLILRNLLDGCTDAFVLRAAEMFFRSQQLAVYEGSLLAADVETYSERDFQQPPPLVSLLGLPAAPPGIDVLSETNAPDYWQRSDSFDMALDLTAGRRGLAALGEVVARWVSHLLAVDVAVDAVNELRDVSLNWYVGLDSSATRIGDLLWRGEDLDEATRELIVGLYRLAFSDERDVAEQARGTPTYLITAADTDMTLRLKPQNLVAGLPLRQLNGSLS
jgi:Family of unknown function (DUF6352)